MTFWLAITIACLAWYGSVTVYVAIKGVFDIRGMLSRLREGKAQKPPP
jgi:hypothetical protein